MTSATTSKRRRLARPPGERHAACHRGRAHETRWAVRSQDDAMSPEPHRRDARRADRVIAARPGRRWPRTNAASPRGHARPSSDGPIALLGPLGEPTIGAVAGPPICRGPGADRGGGGADGLTVDEPSMGGESASVGWGGRRDRRRVKNDNTTNCWAGPPSLLPDLGSSNTAPLTRAPGRAR